MQQNKLTIIGVTGITGSGTSTVAAILAERGGFITNADKLAHEVMGKNEPAYKEIIKTFGNEYLNENGEINRRLLGKKVFSDKTEREKLEKIIHPLVIKRTQELVNNVAELDNFTFAVIDAPLLIESGMDKMCDSCWLITAPDDLRIERITVRDNISEELAKRRLLSRSGDEVLRQHANIIIENSGSPIALRSKIETALKAMSLKIHGWDGMKVLDI